MQGFIFNGVFVKFALLKHFDPLFAKRTETEIEEDSRSQPSDFKTLFETFDMEDMSTLTSYARRSRQSFNVANCTVLIPIHTIELGISLCAFLT